MHTIDPQALQQRLDKQAITEVLMRYCRCVDRRDFGRLRTLVYWLDAKDDQLVFSGDVDGFIGFCEQMTRDMPTQHFLANVLIEMSDATHAFVEPYLVAYHDMKEAQGRVDIIVGGRYLDMNEKRGSDWCMQQRTVAVDWFSRTPGAADWQTGMFASVRTRGQSKPADPLYSLHPRRQNA